MLNKIQYFNFSAIHTPICVIGGGTGALNFTSQISHYKGVQPKMLRVFDNTKIHYYQPSWTMVGGGIYDAHKSQRLQESLFDPQINMTYSKVKQVIPDQNKIITEDDTEFTYEQLVVASGIETNFKGVKGMKEALDDPDCPVGSIYWKDYAVKFSNLVDRFQGGNVIFTEPQQPIKCGGAPQKIMYLTEQRFRDKGIRKRCHIEFQKTSPVVFAVPKYSEALTKIIAEKDITLKLKSKLVEIKPKERIAVFEDQDTKQLIEHNFDLMHVVPPQIAPSYIAQSGLGDAQGFCDVDKNTLIHKKYKNVWSVGDSSSLPTSKTAAAIMGQTPVLVQNIIHMWRDNLSESTLPAKYEGYTSCPIFTGDYKLILAEFKYNAVVDETFYSQQDKPHYAFYFLKKYFFPFAYWNFMSKGIWYGRQGIFPHLSKHFTGIF